jgi:hypothetical protein
MEFVFTMVGDEQSPLQLPLTQRSISLQLDDYRGGWF